MFLGFLYAHHTICKEFTSFQFTYFLYHFLAYVLLSGECDRFYHEFGGCLFCVCWGTLLLLSCHTVVRSLNLKAQCPRDSDHGMVGGPVLEVTYGLQEDEALSPALRVLPTRQLSPRKPGRREIREVGPSAPLEGWLCCGAGGRARKKWGSSDAGL